MLLHKCFARWQHMLFIASNRILSLHCFKTILLNNALRQRGYENKPTKKLHLPKYFDI